MCALASACYRTKHSQDLLRKMNYYFRIGDKIGAIKRKYARMQIQNLRANCVYIEKKKLYRIMFHRLLITFDKSSSIQRKIRLFNEDCFDSSRKIF